MTSNKDTLDAHNTTSNTGNVFNNNRSSNNNNTHNTYNTKHAFKNWRRAKMINCPIVGHFSSSYIIAPNGLIFTSLSQINNFFEMMTGVCGQQMTDFLLGLSKEPIKIISSCDELFEILSDNVRQYRKELRQRQYKRHDFLVSDF